MFNKTKEKDFIAKKEQELESLKELSFSALNVVTKTIDNLSIVNETIDNTINEITEAKSRLQNTEDDLNKQKTYNSKIISKFKALIDED